MNNGGIDPYTGQMLMQPMTSCDASFPCAADNLMAPPTETTTTTSTLCEEGDELVVKDGAFLLENPCEAVQYYPSEEVRSWRA